MSNYYTLFLFALFFSASMVAQITNGTPKSWSEPQSVMAKSMPVPLTMPEFDLAKLQAEDAINDTDNSKTYRFGYEFEVDLGIDNAGSWTELANGDRIWRINIISKNAKTLNFIFDSYKLPKGAEVYLYNKKDNFVLGAYTDTMNNTEETVGTWLADGPNITIEYYEPKAVRGTGKLHIGSVIHGYRSISNAEALLGQTSLNSSGNCNFDVNCSVGSDFEPIKERLKRSVALVIVNNGQGFCSGTLINNTSNDRAPYLLTANHCGLANATWSFRFNWISLNSVCATSQNSIDNGSNNFHTTSGAVSLASSPKSDMQLIEMTGGLNTNWDLEWAGWDVTGLAPNFVVGIHHPLGDIMKVCRDNSGVIKALANIQTASNVDVWSITDAGGGWEFGVTEKGSSGSALFDPKGRIIGKLTGGSASCNGTADNGFGDIYGRLDVSWNFGSTKETRLSDWLDPQNTGRTTLNMLSEEESLSVEDRILENENTIFPIPSAGIFTISNKKGNQLEFDIFDINGKEISTGNLSEQNQKLNISFPSSGIYFITIKDVVKKSAFTKKLIINK